MDEMGRVIAPTDELYTAHMGMADVQNEQVRHRAKENMTLWTAMRVGSSAVSRNEKQSKWCEDKASLGIPMAECIRSERKEWPLETRAEGSPVRAYPLLSDSE